MPALSFFHKKFDIQANRKNFEFYNTLKKYREPKPSGVKNPTKAFFQNQQKRRLIFICEDFGR